MEYDSQVEKVYEWAEQKLTGCPVRDGISFYNPTEKIFKILRRQKGWYIEFSVPVPECQGLKVLTDEEAKTKKLGRTRWVFRGTSDEDAQMLVKAATVSIPRRHIIEPAMTRELRVVSGATCPCLKKMEKLQEVSNMPIDLLEQLKDAYELLQAGRYSDFIPQIRNILGEVSTYLLQEKGIESTGDFRDRLNLLIERKILSRSLRDEVEEVFNRNIFERHYEDQERAYPVALMLVSFTGKLFKLCS